MGILSSCLRGGHENELYLQEPFSELIKQRSKTIKEAEAQIDRGTFEYGRNFDPIPDLSDSPNIILDTDVGSDVDDAMALLMLMHINPKNCRLLGVVTVTTDVEIRKAIAERILKAKKDDTYFSNVPVIAGISNPRKLKLSPNTIEALFILKETPEEIKRLKEESADTFLRKRKPIEKYKELLEQLNEEEKAIILCIGPLTNIAQLYAEYPDLVKKRVDRLVILGGAIYSGGNHKIAHYNDMKIGEIYDNKCNFNLSYDVISAHYVISKATHWNQTLIFITREATQRLSFQAHLNQFLSMQEPEETKIVVDIAKKYREIRGMSSDIKPHDTVAVIEAVSPNTICKYKRGWFYIDKERDCSAFITDPDNGPHYAAVDTSASDFMTLMLKMFASELRLRDINVKK